MENKTKWKAISLLILLLIAVFSMFFLPRVLKSQGQGDGLPEIISGLTFLVISPAIILFSLLSLFNLIIKNESVFIGGLGGIILGVIFSIFGGAFLIPLSIISGLIFLLITNIFNYKCSGECGEFFIFARWINLLISCIIGMFIGFIISNKKSLISSKQSVYNS